jgi:hypothetical protein
MIPGGAFYVVTISLPGYAVPAYPCPYGDCRVSPRWIEVYPVLRFTLFLNGFPSGASSGGGGNTGPKLRPRTRQEYEACVQQAGAAHDQRIQNDRIGQAASGALALLGTAIIYEGGVKGGNPPMLSGETQVELLLHAHGVGWLYANAGLFGPAGVGVTLFTYFSIDIAGAEDAYNRAATSCVGAVPAP